MRRRLDLKCSNGHENHDVIVTEDILLCPDCGASAESWWPGGDKFYVNGDDIPGGLEIKHAICWPDGTPRKYYSKSEIRRAAALTGWTIHGETPKLPTEVEDRKWKEAEAKGRKFI